MEHETNEEVVDIRELESRLTKRNEQYIFDLKKAFAAANLPEETQERVLKEILPQLIDGQKNGTTARQLFGTVGEYTKKVLESPAPSKESSRFWLWVDNSLLMLAIMGLITGGMKLISKKSGMSLGLISMIIISMLGGVAFLVIYEYVYKYDKPGADRSKKPGMIKTGFIMFGVMLLLLVSFSAVTVLIPASINIVLDPVINMIIGAAAFGIRHLMKKKLGIQGGYFGR